MAGRFTDKFLFNTSAENALYYHIDFADGLRFQFVGLHDSCQLRDSDFLELHVTKNRLNVFIIMSLIGIGGAGFQLDCSIILEIPVGKFRETHTLVQFRIVPASVLKLIGKLLSHLFCFLRRYAPYALI